MYDELRIQGLRALDDVDLKGLRRINLIVGRNNVGKTTLLEGLLLLGAGTDPSMLVTLGLIRGQRIDRDRPDPEPIWRSYQHGFVESRIIEVAGRWRGEPNHRVLRITREMKQVTSDIDEERSVARAFGETRLNGIDLEYISAAGRTFHTSARLEGEKLQTVGSKHRDDFLRTVLVSARARTLEREAEQYGFLLKTKREGDVLDALRLLDDRIQRLELVYEAAAPSIYVDLGFPTLVPLAVCGDGVVRLFSFVVELTSARGGVVLIDEVDAGLHFSVMEPFWRALRALAEKHDVQIFATTHNDELLRSALAAFPDDLAWLGLYRLDRRKQGIVAVGYDEETLATVRDERFEVRG